MEHMAAINQTLVGICLGLLVYFSGCTWFMVKRILKKNDEDHDRFNHDIIQHNARLTRVETKLENR